MNIALGEILIMLGTVGLLALKVALIIALIVWIVRAVSKK